MAWGFTSDGTWGWIDEEPTSTTTTTTPTTTSTSSTSSNTTSNTAATTMTTNEIPRNMTAEQEADIQNTVYTNVDNPTISANAIQTYTKQNVQDNELLSGTLMGDTGNVSTATGTSTKVATPGDLTAPTYTASTSGSATVDAAKGTVSDSSLVEAAKVALSDEATVDYKYENIVDEALVSKQLSLLLTGMEDGEIPLWAQPAVAAVNKELAERGVGRSTVARDSLFNAIITAALPIAEGDAKAKQLEWVENLDTKEKYELYNATLIANTDLKNADYLMTARTQNAQTFLTMDLNNLTNEQRSNEISAQYRQDSMLSNTAAENAAKQFNASSEAQTQQFMAELAATIEKDNAARADAMAQYNAGQENAQAQFNAQLDYNREQFNATVSNQIEQANVEWRRTINTANTAGENAANQANAINYFNLSTTSLAYLWQEMRDAAKWTVETSENDQERQMKLAVAALTNESATDATKVELLTKLGAAALNLFSDTYKTT